MIDLHSEVPDHEFHDETSEPLFIFVVDKSVVEHSQALINPKSGE